jgi:hypothetical protein
MLHPLRLLDIRERCRFLRVDSPESWCHRAMASGAVFSWSRSHGIRGWGTGQGAPAYRTRSVKPGEETRLRSQAESSSASAVRQAGPLEVARQPRPAAAEPDGPRPANKPSPGCRYGEYNRLRRLL